MRLASFPRAWLVATLALSACATKMRATLPISDLVALKPDPSVYQVLHAGDEVEVRFDSAPELNIKLLIRPDGTIKLPLSDTLDAAGRTPEDVEREIELVYGAELRSPNATVVVIGFGGRMAHIGGEVVRPGPLVLGAPRTLLEALITVGGLRDSAHHEQVLLVRTLEDGKRRVFELDLTEVIDGYALQSDVFLQPTDIVYVPRSPISEVNLWVDQYIRKNLPFDVTVRPDLGVD